MRAALKKQKWVMQVWRRREKLQHVAANVRMWNYRLFYWVFMGSLQSTRLHLCCHKHKTHSGIYNPCSEQHLDLSEEELAKLKTNILTGDKKMEETWGRATEEGSFSLDGPTCTRCLQNRTKKKSITVYIFHWENIWWRVWIQDDQATDERPRKITIRKPPSECKHRASLISSCSSDRLLHLFFSLCSINPPS